MFYMPSEENIKRIFYADVREKKSAGYGYQHKKNGSKSKSCRLPSDHMTEKEWKKMNGEVKTYNTNHPLVWDDFKVMPADLREEYLRNLDARVGGVTLQSVADAMGVHVVTLRNYMKECDLRDVFYSGKRMKTEQKAALVAFYNNEMQIPAVETECNDSEIAEECSEISRDIENNCEDISECNNCDSTSESDTNSVSAFVMKEFEVKFEGPFDADHLANTLRHMIHRGTVVKIEVECKIQEE